MTVQELIDKLLQYPPDRYVFLRNWGVDWGAQGAELVLDDFETVIMESD